MSKTFNFSDFMRKEFALYSKEYASQGVSIVGKNKIDKSQGGVFLFLHFGSFFLSGVSLISQLGINYTAIASTINFKAMNTGERKFWREVHKIANKLYSRKMFLSHKGATQEILKYLSSGSYIGAAIDVSEIGKKHKFEPFTFLCNKVYLQTSPARLARLAKVPLYGMTISYNSTEEIHTLQITGPYDSNKIGSAVQNILTEMEPVVRNNMDQLFHDVFHLFSLSRLKDHMITLSPKKKSTSIPPVKKLKPKLPMCYSPRYESQITSWHPHRDFAYNLIKEYKPRVIVELGVHYGDSYFTFCQACEELELDTQLFGIDHWQGDEQTGFYEDEVFETVSSYNEEFYPEQSTLLRMDFEEGLQQFEDQTVDLLHIDGSHDYESVKNDFNTWRPKVNKGGMVLLHDILVEREDFGVKKFWKEISKKYKTESHHEGFGLGIIHC